MQKSAGKKIEWLLLIFVFIHIPFALTAGAENEALIKRINAAYGEEKTLLSIQDMTLKGSVTMETPEGPLEMPVIFFAQRPDRLMIVTEILPHAEFIQAFDGEHAWITLREEIRDMPEAAAGEFKMVALTIIDGWLHHQDKRIEITPLEDQILEGKEYIVLEVKGPNQNVSHYYQDKSTLLLARMQGRMVNARGDSAPSELFFDDYKNFHGLNIACTVRAEQDGNTLWKQTIDEVTINSGFKEGFFAKPAPPEEEKKTEEEKKEEGEKEAEVQEQEDQEKSEGEGKVLSGGKDAKQK